MELRHLRYFIAVAEERHVTRAAARLGIAQPPLTQQIKALERELGVPLFMRAGRGVALTAAGEAFLDDARAILAQAASAARKARDTAQGLRGRLKVGFTESASFHPLVAESFRAFRGVYPEVELMLREGPSTELISAIGAGALDVAFVRPPLPASDAVTFEILAEEAMIAALPTSHRLCGRDSLDLRDLADERFILYPRATRPGLTDAVVEACRQAGFDPNVVQEAPQLSSTINMVAAGMGLSIVPDCLKQVRPQDVRFLPIRDLALKARLGLALRASDPSPLAQNLRAAVSLCLGQPVPG
jgi:DNA-binding transcriptional LysR family regulator